jgi:hypothetical protein
MSLSEEIDKMRKEIRTDGYPMSIGEWISLYENNEIDIHPEFQRYYRWSETQKTKLIESILLGIPIPPIFVHQREDGVWDVVDGLQRLSTIYQFFGILKDEKKKKVSPLVLEKTEYLPSLGGMKWDDPHSQKHSLSQEQKLIIKRSKISVSIILRESDQIAKFELFQRLNTGGSNLTPQEVRNCILVILNNKLYQWLRKLSEYENFQDCVNLSEDPIAQQYDLELVLRFAVFATIKTDELNNLGDIGVFLTRKMMDFAKSSHFNPQDIETRFKATFDILAKTVGQNAFRKYSFDKKKFVGGFVVSPYEVIACGLGFHNDKVSPKAKIEQIIQNLWKNNIYTKWSGSGMTATRRLPKLIPLGRKLFSR